MQTMRTTFLIALAATLLPNAGFAASPGLQARLDEARIAPTVQVLEKRTDADSWAAAGLLSHFWDREQSLRRVARASGMAPGRADLLWLHIQFCREDASCDTEPLEMRLRELDGKNGAAWFAALGRASRGGDEQGKSAALAAIARSERVDTYWTSLNARLSRQVASANAVPPLDGATEVFGLLAAIPDPAYSVISNTCRGERLERQDVLDMCRGIAASLMNGDTIITEMTGTSLARRIWPENSPKWVEATEARRTADYRMHHSNKWTEAHVSEYLALFAQHRREQDVMKAVLIEIGENPNPPPGWERPAPGN